MAITSKDHPDWTHDDYLAAMRPEQKACRYRHRGFPPLIWRNGKPPKGFDASPMPGGGIEATETCQVCTTKLVYRIGSSRMLDEAYTKRYEYPEWWVHVPIDVIGGNVTSMDCKDSLIAGNYSEIVSLAARKAVAA